MVRRVLLALTLPVLGAGAVLLSIAAYRWCVVESESDDVLATRDAVELHERIIVRHRPIYDWIHTRIARRDRLEVEMDYGGGAEFSYELLGPGWSVEPRHSLRDLRHVLTTHGEVLMHHRVEQEPLPRGSSGPPRPRCTIRTTVRSMRDGGQRYERLLTLPRPAEFHEPDLLGAATEHEHVVYVDYDRPRVLVLELDGQLRFDVPVKVETGHLGIEGREAVLDEGIAVNLDTGATRTEPLQ